MFIEKYNPYKYSNRINNYNSIKIIKEIITYKSDEDDLHYPEVLAVLTDIDMKEGIDE